MSLIDNEYLNRTFNFVNDYEIIEGSEYDSSWFYNLIISHNSTYIIDDKQRRLFHKFI